MSTTTSRIALALVGLVGVVVLSASFAINPGPPAGASIPQIVAWGRQHETLIEAGAWMQVVGSFLQLVFILGILYITGAIRRFAGLITASAVVLIMGVSLVESSFYLSAIAGGVSGDLTMLSVSLNLIKAIQHAYSIIPAPALDACLGVVLLTSTLFAGRFGRALGVLGIAFGVALAVLGFFGTFTPLQQAIDNVLTAQQVWLLAIAVAVALTARARIGVRGETRQPVTSAAPVASSAD